MWKGETDYFICNAWHLHCFSPWGACSGRHESPQDWRSVRAGDLHIHTFWDKQKTQADYDVFKRVRSGGLTVNKRGSCSALPAAQASRHADVVKQNQMLDELTEADSSSVRTNRHWGKRHNASCFIALFLTQIYTLYMLILSQGTKNGRRSC